MPDPVWYRSLYWRIALGFVALLASLLVIQGTFFLWITGRMTDLFPNRSPAQFAATLAADVGMTISERPETELDSYINERYSSAPRGFVVALNDGRLVVSKRVPPPPVLIRIARGRVFEDHTGDRRGPPDGPGDNRFRRGGGGDRGGFGPPGQAFEFSSVIANATVVGVVAVPVEPPPLSLVLRDLGPLLATVALVLLVTGTAVSALVIFRPVRRRLRELEDAARALGEGETNARAPEGGGDEVSALARSFNEMANQLEQRTLALEQANRMRRQLLADVSHELTTPLAAIRGYVETLGMPDVPLSADTRTRYLGIVGDETERLEHIVGDLLDLARVEGGGGMWRTQQVPVAHLLERVRHRHDPALIERRITLETEQSPDVTVVIGDQNRIEQALQNLVANAIRHTPVGGRVLVRAAMTREGTTLTVEDTGPGIPPEHLERVFDRFYKVDESRTGTDTPSGSGLGLSIVRAIVARHGGTVSASNLPGAGARFQIVLPAVPAS